jgi:glycosyltransferase involved in cell wall biosynthesis
MIEKNELNLNAHGGSELMQECLDRRLPPHLRDAFQIILSRVRTLKDKPRILWLQDLAEDVEVQPLKDPKFRNQFARLIYASHWQMQRYAYVLGVPYGEGQVLHNAIEPIAPRAKSRNGVKLIYHTTPHRGLSLLVPAFIKLCEIHKDIELDVYSSFKLYGWEDRDKPFQPLFDTCRNHPKINYHGAVSNEEIRRALQDAHIFAYPSIWQETSCIAMIEAMSAGCVTVCPNLAALPETAANFAAMYQFQEDPQIHANHFANVLHKAIKMVKRYDEDLQAQLRFQKQYFDAFYSWDGRIQEWISLMEGILRT